VKTLIQFVLRAYKRWISPALPAACRYVPSCSEYACDAIEHHGAPRGSALAIWRLLRCHPFAKGGYDPVPTARPLTPDSRVLTPEVHQSHGK
jgi:putative membrane protein insertion efficiency factor